MKKSVVFSAIAIILLSFVYAQNESEISEKNFSQGVESLRGIAEKADSLTEKEIIISETIKPFLEYGLGIKSPTTISNLVIYTSLWILFFFTFSNMMYSFSPFSKTTATVTSLVLVILLSTIGLIRILTEGLLSLSRSIKFIDEWSSGALATIVVLVIIALILIQRVIKYFREEKELENAREKGIQIGADMAMIGWIKKMFTKLGSSD